MQFARKGDAMPNPYIPRADAEFLSMAQSFAKGISDDPARYMLAPAQAESIQGAVDRFVAAFKVATNEATRNKGTVINKDDARHIAEQLIRQYAMLIKGNAGIDDSDKINIGVPPVNRSRTVRRLRRS
jgi:hypothetical protein